MDPDRNKPIFNPTCELCAGDEFILAILGMWHVLRLMDLIWAFAWLWSFAIVRRVYDNGTHMFCEWAGHKPHFLVCGLDLCLKIWSDNSMALEWMGYGEAWLGPWTQITVHSWRGHDASQVTSLSEQPGIWFLTGPYLFYFIVGILLFNGWSLINFRRVVRTKKCIISYRCRISYNTICTTTHGPKIS